MQQKVFLIGEIYLFCIYFSLNNFNYPNKKLAIPSKLRNSSAEFPRHSRKTFAEEKKIAWVLGVNFYMAPGPKTRFPEGGYPADIRRIPGGYPADIRRKSGGYPPSGGVLRMDFP